MHAVSCYKCGKRLKPTNFLKRNFYFETEGVQNLKATPAAAWKLLTLASFKKIGLTEHNVHSEET